MKKSISVVFSTQENSTISKLGLSEIKELSEKNSINIQFVKWVAEGIGLLAVESDFETFSQAMQKATFVRHIFPAYFQKEIEGDTFFEIEQYCDSIIEELDIHKSKKIGVQGYITADNEYFRKSEVADKIVKALESNNYNVDNVQTNFSISFVMTNKNIYIGYATTYHTLSKWTLGKMRFKKEDDLISRASFKLMEAFEVFDIDENIKKAVDLGAAPGGWTKVLAEKGYKVDAVDPAKLDKRVFDHKNVTCYNMSSQDYLQRNTEKYDFLVNDMKMDAIKSSEIMNEMSENLKENGQAIMTLKLPEKKQKGKIIDATRILNEKYKIIKIKQLFHNRSEVTVFMKKKG